MISNYFKKALYLPVISLFILMSSHAQAIGGPSFDEWMQGLKKDAAKQGISQSIIDEALTDIKPIERVIELDRKQPESTITFEQYRKRIVSDWRIQKGRELMEKHEDQLERVSQKYGVAPQYIVALWGIETNYGKHTGGFNIIPALATLAWEGRRGAFFKKELIQALHILDEGHIDVSNMKGSWAGAMGQNQFMPSSFKSFAVDGDSDGKKDIWTNLDDIFSSSSNYLARSGWKSGERWGREVILPQGFTEDMGGLKIRKPLAEWKKMGVKQLDGSAIPVVKGMEASIVIPGKLGGPAYIVYNNYRTIMRWNRSTYFATSVGLLADAISYKPSH